MSPTPPAKGLSRILHEAREQWLPAVVGACLFSIATLAECSIPAIGGKMLDAFQENAGKGAAALPSLDAELPRIMGVFVAMAVLKHMGEYFMRLAGERTVASVRSRLFCGLLHRELAFFDEQATGTLVSLLTSDVQAIHLTVTDKLPHVLRHAVLAIVAAGHMAYISPRLTLLIGLAAPLVGLTASTLGHYVHAFARRQQQQMGVATATATESIGAVRCIKTFGQEALMSARYTAEVSQYCVLSMEEMLLHKMWNAFNFLFGGVTTIFALREAGRDVLSGDLTVGSAITFAVYGVSCGTAANDAANCWQQASANAAKASKALEMVDEEERRSARVVEAEKRLEAQWRHTGLMGATCSEVRLESVRFSYPTETPKAETTVIDDVSLAVSADRVLALVGPSGSGKSTLLRLLLRFYLPTSGTISIGGTPLHRLPTEWLRRHVCIVEQEPTLFRASLRENIAFGAPSPEASSAATGGEDEGAAGELLARRLVSAAKAANAHEFILEAGGYDANVGERGATLSGGQRQRIAIARALLREPSILLLDEATASLDAHSEQLVQEAISRLTTGRATIVVAHRLSTVRAADEILVLEGGRVIERGTHNILVDAGGLYSHLSALQRLDKTIEASAE